MISVYLLLDLRNPYPELALIAKAWGVQTGAPCFWKSKGMFPMELASLIMFHARKQRESVWLVCRCPASCWHDEAARQAKPFLISVLDKPGFRADIPHFRPRNQCGSNSG